MKKIARSQIGFTLIEVLVAILIVAVGILGVAGMQVVSLQQNGDALLRDTGLQLGNDIMDRTRANAGEAYAPIAFDDEPSFGTNCLDVRCSPEEMKDFDIAQWKCRISPFDEDRAIYSACQELGIDTAALPDGRGRIVGGVEGAAYEVAVDWISDREGNRSQIILRTIVTDRPQP